MQNAERTIKSYLLEVYSGMWNILRAHANPLREEYGTLLCLYTNRKSKSKGEKKRKEVNYTLFMYSYTQQSTDSHTD